MPYLPTAQAFLEQSTLLISARPTTTRISTTYRIPHPSPPPCKYKPTSLNPKSRKPDSDLTPSEAAARARELQPTLTVKTYDTASHTCLKYKTDKAAEVGRLVASLGRCGRVMAALPLEDEKVDGMDGVEREEVPREGKTGLEQRQEQEQEKGKGGGGEGGGAGGGKKKKKGKR